MDKKVQVLVINGSVGVGKSSVADAISEIFKKKSIPHAVISMDHLRYAYPRPQNDHFHYALAMKNLAAIWENYKEVGVKYLIIPSVVESRNEIDDYHTAIPNSEVIVLRLTAKLGTIQQRLKNRETGETLAWHINRSVELSKQLEEKKIDDFVVETDGKTISEIAEEVLSKTNLKKAK